MQINIKKIGFNRGTSGWLAAGLADSSIVIRECLTKSGKHALWLAVDGSDHCLAIQNQYNLSPSEFVDADKYCTYDDGRIQGLTNAAWEALQDCAQDWCDACNVARDNDASLSLSVARLEPQTITA